MLESEAMLRVNEQLRAIWNGRDKDWPVTRGLLMSGKGNARVVQERYFTLLCHTIFVTPTRESTDFIATFLTDLFSSAVVHVDDKTLEAFGREQATSGKLALELHLCGELISHLEILLCPSTLEERKGWIDKFFKAGLSVPTRQVSPHKGREDGRDKVVVIEGSINDTLFHEPSKVPSGRRKSIQLHWRWLAERALKLPVAATVRKRVHVLGKLVASEQRYVNDLSTLNHIYLNQFKVAMATGTISIQHQQLEMLFLNCEQLLTLHRLLLSVMTRALDQPSPCFGDLLLTHVPHMDIYIEFIKNHEQSIKVLEECLQMPSVSGFLENHHSSHDCEAQQLKLLLHGPVTRLEMYWAFVEEVIKHTSNEHCDFRPLEEALDVIQNLIKQDIAKKSSNMERRSQLVSIIESVGVRGFLLLQPNCELVLEEDMYIPNRRNYGGGSWGRRKNIHCYLYTNALVVISDRKNGNQVFPLSGASIYSHVSKRGEVTYAKDPDIDIKALKVYSPDGPRNGLVVAFPTQSMKTNWVYQITQMIGQCTVEPEARAISFMTHTPPPSLNSPHTPPPSFPGSPNTPPHAFSPVPSPQHNSFPMRRCYSVLTPSPKRSPISTPKRSPIAFHTTISQRDSGSPIPLLPRESPPVSTSKLKFPLPPPPISPRNSLASPRDSLFSPRESLISSCDSLISSRDSILSSRDSLLSQHDGLSFSVPRLNGQSLSPPLSPHNSLSVSAPKSLGPLSPLSSPPSMQDSLEIPDSVPKFKISVTPLPMTRLASVSVPKPHVKPLELIPRTSSVLFNGVRPLGMTRAVSLLSVNTAGTTSNGRIIAPHPPDRQYFSLPALFSKLTNPPSQHYATTFLLTYRMFTNAQEVLDALIEAHRTELAARTNGREIALSTQSLRFFNTLKLWVSKYYVDFHGNVSLKRVLLVYLSTIQSHRHAHTKEKELAGTIIATMKSRGHIPLLKKSKLKLQVPRPRKVLPLIFSDIPVVEAADQLTWLEHGIYSRIKPYEFLQQKWTKKNRHDLAPNICYVISRFNEMTCWVAKEILSRDHARQRSAVVERMLQIAEQCHKLNNFVTVFQITSALTSASIQRLRGTWECLPQAAVDRLEEYKQLTSLENSSKAYRSRQQSSPSPSVPYIGAYLSQLISIEVGMPTFVKSPPEHVNFTKLTKLASVIEEVTRFQNPHYSIDVDGAIQAFLDNCLESANSYDDDKRFSRSMEIEPREEHSRGKSFIKMRSTG